MSSGFHTISVSFRCSASPGVTNRRYVFIWHRWVSLSLSLSFSLVLFVSLGVSAADYKRRFYDPPAHCFAVVRRRADRKIFFRFFFNKKKTNFFAVFYPIGTPLLQGCYFGFDFFVSFLSSSSYNLLMGNGKISAGRPFRGRADGDPWITGVTDKRSLIGVRWPRCAH